jgi:hypothetical protein
MQRCPVCRATFNGETICRRCHADLSALLKIEQEAESLAKQAAQLWVARKSGAAVEAARSSLALKITPLARAILLLAQNDQNCRVGNVDVFY